MFVCMVQENGEEEQETTDSRRRSEKGSVDCAASYKEVRVYAIGDGVLLKDFLS